MQGPFPRRKAPAFLAMRSSLIKFVDAIIDFLLRKGFCLFRPMRIDRIGHLAGEIDLWLKERALQGKRGKAFALIACPESTANIHILSYFQEHFRFLIPPAKWDRLVAKVFPFPLNRFQIERPDYYIAINQTANCWPIYSAWGDRAPLFELREADRIFLRSVLRDWGLPENSWFVCLHNRERGYSPSDDYMHIYRNASIENYLLAVQEITKRGGWVIRMGDPNMAPFPSLPQVIDYAHSPFRSARLDVCLSASARFFLATTSGLFMIGLLFGVPCVMVNCAPMSMTALTSMDLAIPKLFHSPSGRLISFPEIMNSPLGNYRFNEEYEKAGIRVESNSAEDIRDLTLEMLERLDGTCHYTEEDENLQRQFRALFRPGHYAYGSKAQTGRKFLRAHRDLLSDQLAGTPAEVAASSAG
jgi:putative glycosyltransferase (TIGR04372 family)